MTIQQDFDSFVESLAGGIETAEDIDNFDPTGTVYYQGEDVLTFSMSAFSWLGGLSPEMSDEVIEFIGRAVRFSCGGQKFDLVCVAAPGIVSAYNTVTGERLDRTHVIGLVGKIIDGPMMTAVIALDESGNRKIIRSDSPFIMNQFAPFFKGFFE